MLIDANFLNIPQSTPKTVRSIFRVQLPHLHQCHLSPLNYQTCHGRVTQVSFTKSAEKSLTWEVPHCWSLATLSTSSCRCPNSPGIHSELIRHFKQALASPDLLSSAHIGQHPTLGANCHTGVVFDNVSIIFVLWALSINNKVGFVQFASLYWGY